MGVHLFSDQDDHVKRKDQFQYLCTKIPEGNDCIIMGDYNLHYAKEDELFLQHHFVDLWSQIHPKDKGITFPDSSLRLDRIGLRETKLWKGKSIEILHNNVNSKHHIISYHHGLFAVLHS